MRKSSSIALLFVLLVIGGSFLWWAGNRPSLLLYQAHSRLGKGNPSAVIAEYKKILQRPALAPEEEIRLRKALGEFYLKAVQEKSGFSLYMRDDYAVDHPYLAAAKNEFEKVLKLDPDDGFSHYALGRIFLVQKLESFALQELQRSVKTLPRSAEPLRILSLIHQERGESGDALEYALRAVATDPRDDEARMALITAYFSMGEPEKALQEYKRISPSFLSRPAARTRYAFHLAQEKYWKEAAQQLGGTSLADDENLGSFEEIVSDGWAQIHFGRILLLQGRVDEASGRFAQAADLLPHSVWPVIWQARAYSLRRKCVDVLRVGQKLTENHPRWAWARLVNAWGFLCRQNEKAALAEVNEALRLSHDFPEARELKARLYLDKGMYEELGAFLRPWLDKKSNEAGAYIFLAESFFLQSNVDLCLEMAEAAIKIHPRDERAFVWLGLARARKGDASGAQRAFENALSLNHTNSEAAGYEAYARALGGRPVEAEADLIRLLESDGSNAVLWHLLGEVRRLKEDFSGAVQAYQNAAAERPYFLRAYLGLLTISGETGWTDKAEAALSHAIEINPRNKEVSRWRSKARKQS